MKRHTIKEILKKSELAPTKKLGQNFLVCPKTIAAIIAKSGVSRQDRVLELGVGLGSLTKPLAEAAQQVTGLEVDRGIIRFHQREEDLPANVELHEQDLLLFDYQQLAMSQGAPLKIMANLPYSISNPLLFKLLEVREYIDWAVLMLQKEVGQRLCASPASKEYGILTVLYGGCSTIDKVLNVPPHAFHPRPKVDSVVIKINFQPPPYADAALSEPTLLKKVVKAGFNQRRKTLLNALAAAKIGFSKAQIEQALTACELAVNIRAERLSFDHYLKLCLALQQSTPGGP